MTGKRRGRLCLASTVCPILECIAGACDENQKMAHVSRDLCLALLPTLHYAPLLLSSSWPTFAAVLAFTTFVSAQNLAFAWPKYPESHAESSLTCDGGTPPVRSNKLI